MHTHPATSATRKIAITLIGGYQKYISPHKGFSCAYRLLRGGESCSQYIKRLIAQEGFIAAVKASQQRFRACREANDILRSRHYHHSNTGNNVNRDLEDRRNKPKRNTSSDCTGYSDCPLGEVADCADCTVDCTDCISGLDFQGLDCSGLDCSVLDYGLADCGACDVGSCG